LLRIAPGHQYLARRGRPGLVRFPGGTAELPVLPEAFETLLERLPVGTDSVIATATASGAEAARTLRVLGEFGVLEDVVADASGEPIALARRPRLVARAGCRSAGLRLAPDAFVRPTDEGWAVLRPGIVTSAVLAGNRVGLLDRLDAESPEFLGDLLFDNRLAVADGNPAGPRWEFHDALFHAASVHGTATGGPYGARPGWAPVAEPPPYGPLDPDRGEIEDLAWIAEDSSPSLYQAFALRASCRVFAAEPVSQEALGRLLDLALRTRPRQAVPGVAFHAYPSGGALDEISTLVGRLGPDGYLGVYLQDVHRLYRCSGSREQGAEVVTTLCGPCGIGEPLPSIGLLFAADYARIADKYGAIAYATILRNVGAIYQTVSLAAAALGLAACPVGGGWSALESRTVTGLLHGRVLVGGMLLGTPRSALP
jgi:SagB-type dehydrogenase family enzyme